MHGGILPFYASTILAFCLLISAPTHYVNKSMTVNALQYLFQELHVLFAKNISRNQKLGLLYSDNNCGSVLYN